MRGSMGPLNRRQEALAVLLSFVAGIASAVLVPKLIGGAAHRWLLPKDRHEVERTTSPDGTVDAVTEVTECGAPCSSTYIVSVVPRGRKASRDAVQQVFVADDLVNARVHWKELYLLDISYDRAFIHSFCNVAYPLGRPGDVESWRYAVEIHLSPSSARFSYLPDAKPAKASQ